MNPADEIEIDDEIDEARSCSGVVDLDVPNAWAELPVRRRRRHRLTILLDPSDGAAVVAGLLEAHCPTGPVVAVHPTPSTRSTPALAFDILAALGRPVRNLGVEKITASGAPWQAVRVWMVADRIECLVVLRAQRLSKQGWNALVELWQETGVGVVLVCHATSRTAATAMLGPDVNPRVVSSIGALTRQFPAARPPESDEPIEVLAQVSDTDVVAFRAQAYRRLTREEFAKVDARSGMAAACRWLHGNPGPIRPAARPENVLEEVHPRGLRAAAARRGTEALAERYGKAELRHLAAGLLCLSGPVRHNQQKLPYRFDDDVELDRFIGDLIADSPTRNHTIALARGAQAGALLHGLLIQMPGHLSRATGPGMTGRPIDVALADRIRASTVSPVHAAALAVAVFTGFTPAELARIPITALSPDASILRWNTAERHLAMRHTLRQPSTERQ